MIQAVVFDMDGLLLDSEVYWARARTDYCSRRGCRWTEEDELSVKGRNSPEWAAVIRQRCGITEPEATVIGEVEQRMRALYGERLPLLPGAAETVRLLADAYPLAIASSSPPKLIEFALREADLLSCFRAIVSADTVGKGKPAPDVFLAAAEGLGFPAAQVAVFEDSTSGIMAGRAAGMMVIAVPNAHYPPSPEALESADLVLASLEDFEPASLEAD